jgi:hypothetical protein
MSIDPTTALWMELQMRARSAPSRADKRDARRQRRRAK